MRPESTITHSNRQRTVKTIVKIFVYKHCFCYLNVENVKQNNSLFHKPIGDVTDIFAIECFCLGTIGLIVSPWKFDVLKTSIFAREASLLGQVFVLRTSNFRGAII